MTDALRQQEYKEGATDLMNPAMSGGVDAMTGRPRGLDQEDGPEKGGEVVEPIARRSQEAIDRRSVKVFDVLNLVKDELNLGSLSILPKASQGRPAILIDYNYDLVRLNTAQVRPNVRTALQRQPNYRSWLNRVSSSVSDGSLSSREMSPGLFYVPLKMEKSIDEPLFSDDTLMVALGKMSEQQLRELFLEALRSEQMRYLIAAVESIVFPDPTPSSRPVQASAEVGRDPEPRANFVPNSLVAEGAQGNDQDQVETTVADSEPADVYPPVAQVSPQPPVVGEVPIAATESIPDEETIPKIE